MSAVVIAASNVLTALREQVSADGEVITFTDTEPIQALQAILETRPSLIVLERLFAATPRGAALINRIKNDPTLQHAEVRVMSHTGDYMRQVSKPAAAAAASAAVAPVVADAVVTAAAGPPSIAAAAPIAAPAAPPVATAPAERPLDWQGTRRAPRQRVRPNVEIQLDGNPVRVVDISAIGAQVISSTILRPNQKVRVGIVRDDTVARFRGTIAWAKFELPAASSVPVYRAGVEFIDADTPTVEDFADRSKEG